MLHKIRYAIIASLQNQNQQLVKDYFQLTTSEQQKHMRAIGRFSKYLQQQRNNDLKQFKPGCKCGTKYQILSKKRTILAVSFPMVPENKNNRNY
jgi:hypothetical protein